MTIWDVSWAWQPGGRTTKQAAKRAIFKVKYVDRKKFCDDLDMRMGRGMCLG